MEKFFRPVRKDREISTIGGGVFQISNEDLITSHLDNLSSTNSESIWTETQIKGINPIVIYICTFYRPPKDTQGFQLDELDQSLSKLGNKINTQNIIIMGDFNLPNIVWGKNAITPNSGYSSIAASKLLTIMEEHGLTQHINVPTHTQGNSNNILDLVLTNRPHFVTSSRQNLPWFTKNLTKLCKRKLRLYNKAKKTRNQDDWQEFCDIRKNVHKQLRSARVSHISQFLTTSIKVHMEKLTGCKFQSVVY